MKTTILNATIDGREVIFDDVNLNFFLFSSDALQINASLNIDGVTESISLFISDSDLSPDLSEGNTFSFEEDNDNDGSVETRFATYRIENEQGSESYITSHNDDTPVGSLTITNVSVTSFTDLNEATENQRVSGIFEFEAFLFNSNESVQITNGSFTNLRIGNN